MIILNYNLIEMSIKRLKTRNPNLQLSLSLVVLSLRLSDFSLGDKVLALRLRDLSLRDNVVSLGLRNKLCRFQGYAPLPSSIILFYKDVRATLLSNGINQHRFM